MSRFFMIWLSERTIFWHNKILDFFQGFIFCTRFNFFPLLQNLFNFFPFLVFIQKYLKIFIFYSFYPPTTRFFSFFHQGEGENENNVFSSLNFTFFPPTAYFFYPPPPLAGLTMQNIHPWNRIKNNHLNEIIISKG